MQLIGRHFGHIRVTQVVGQGGMGDVYGGYDEKLERKVALKVLNDDQRLDGEARERLLREARALSKLDHPNICRIYDYIETKDVDLLVLEYIDGRTLHDALQDRMAHHEKLRIAIAIADVLVQAHRAGIVHRDLKPENVMLTKSGEIKVLDFGLARWLHRTKAKSSDKYVALRGSSIRAVPESAETTPFSFADMDTGPVPRRDFLATAVGITLGTPLFMSPEQARGEVLTPASDMFSFGLLLQALFTGQDPHPMDLTAREVILRVARGETERVKGAPGDITALINRLKQFAPADRPTAIETAEKLRFLDAKPQRIARRAFFAAIAVVALLGVWRYTVDLKRERALAVKAQGQEERRRAQAEDLINFMVGDLRTKLEPVGRLDVLNDAAEKALQYLGSSKPETLSVQELIAHTKALDQLGEVREKQGNMRAAIPLYEQSLQRAELAVHREPTNDDAKFALGLSRFWLANAYRQQNDMIHAAEHAHVYLNVTSDLAARHPDNEPYQLEASYAHSLTGLLLEAQRDFKGAISEYRKTLAIKNAYAARHTSDDVPKEDVARTINKIGYALYKSGNLRAAREQFETEIRLREQLVVRNPKQMRWKQDLAVAHSFLSTVFELLGEPDAAFRHRLADLTLHSELTRLDPSNMTWQRNLAASRIAYGRLLTSRGDRDAAAQNLRQAEQSLRKLLATDSSRQMWRNDLVNMKLAAVRLSLDQKHFETARKEVQEAIGILESRSETAGTKPQLGLAYLNLGYVRHAQHAATDANAAWMKAKSLARPAGIENADVRELETWARVLIALGERDEAVPVVNRLRAAGYKNPDFVSLATTEGY
jgi:tRNA A-37 threonylcarbamoyl transferase component Bud32/tetratricopeptide (TPR) repeat protein